MARFVSTLLAVTLLSVPALAQAEAGPRERSARNTLDAEVGGGGLLYSVGYERMLRDDLGVRLGFGTWSTNQVVSAEGSGNAAKTWFVSLPVGVRWLPVHDDHHALEIGAGVNALWSSDRGEMYLLSTKERGFTPVGFGSVGYRAQPFDGGPVFRLGFDLLAANRLGERNGFGVQPWFHFAAGGAF
ncbi:MAG: hypothetical protein IPJ34_12985 [Myxococcales bacterium]|nr:hypothetical protein [Myxococcales bacterium]